MTAEQTFMEAQQIAANNAMAIRAAYLRFAAAVIEVERCRCACEEAQLRAQRAHSSSREILLRLAAVRRTNDTILRAAAQGSEARAEVDLEDRTRCIRGALLRRLPPAAIGIAPAGVSSTRK